MKVDNNLVVFSDDWGRHPSSCQHIVSQLLDGWQVIWVNTIGMRPARLNIATVQRGFEKLQHWKTGQLPKPERAKPRVLNPLMWPSFGSPWSRVLNRNLLHRSLKRNVDGLESSVFLTTIPVVADLVDRVRGARWIYYCVDDFSKWPGLDSQTLHDMEQLLIRKVDSVVAAGDNLAGRIEAAGRKPDVITHGVDLEHWRCIDSRASAHPRLACLEKPVALFWGLIDQRLDLEFLRALDSSMSCGTIAMVGPRQAPDPGLAEIPRLQMLGPLKYEELPRAATAADVLIMPYADLPITRAMQPLKLKEYLATGKPVVARRLPATYDWEDCLEVVDSADDFAAAVVRSAFDGVSQAQQLSRRRLDQESWAAKARSFLPLLTHSPNECLATA